MIATKSSLARRPSTNSVFVLRGRSTTTAVRIDRAAASSLTVAVESFFQLETHLAGQFIAVAGAAGFAVRRQATIEAIDALLDVFEPDASTRRRWLERAATTLAEELLDAGADEAAVAGTAADALAPPITASIGGMMVAARLRQAVAANGRAIGPLAAQLAAAARAGSLGMTLESLVVQLLQVRTHLLLRSSSAREELAVYVAVAQRSIRGLTGRPKKFVQVRYAAGGAVGCSSLVELNVVA
ncbi:MAG: hypothetical protein K1X74_17995 [Pirellulales bacterium]|nr:hypothetical protein [Pirellulales bacterium]